jgi:tRNA pseudouridine55 synthase
LKTAEDFQNGQILLIDKTLEVELFSGCKQIKIRTDKQLRTSKKFKIGHAGTLDPLATGLLLVCTGKFTKRITELQGQAKEYTGTFF